MKIARKPMKKARIEIIPMIDTMFFLLVFFMIATLSMTNLATLPVNLPHAAGRQDKLQQVVTITLTKEGGLYYDRQPIGSTAEAVERLAGQQKADKSTAVIINADRSVQHGQVVELMDSIRQGGIVKIAVAVNPQD